MFFVRQMLINMLSVYGCLLTCSCICIHMVFPCGYIGRSVGVGVGVGMGVHICGGGCGACGRSGHWRVVIYEPHPKLLATLL